MRLRVHNSFYRVVVSIYEVSVVRQPATTEYYQDHDEHLSKLKYIIKAKLTIIDKVDLEDSKKDLKTRERNGV